MSLDKYEEMKDRRYQTQVLLHQKPVKVSSMNCESLSGSIRWRIAREHTECTDDEIRSNIEDSYQTDRQRQLCFENQDLEAVHIVLESAQRKLRRFGQRAMVHFHQTKDRRQ